MGESERAVTAQAVPAITTSDSASGVVAGEILVDPTAKTPAQDGSVEAHSDGAQRDKVANERGMPPLPRP